MVNHYDVLGVSRESGLEEIKQAYHRLAMEYHPDKNPSPLAAEKMKQINEAYRILGEPALRADYDRRTTGQAGDNIYARWYSQRSDFGSDPAWKDPGPQYATNGYEAPRRTVVRETVIFFSFEHIVAAGIVGLILGIAITAAFILFGLNVSGPGSDLSVLVAFVALSAFLPPFVAVFLLRNELNARSEASMCGSVTLTFALPIWVLVGSLVNLTSDISMAGCLLPFVCLVAGWLIGGFVGRASWDIYR
jgi:DnaJ domain